MILSVLSLREQHGQHAGSNGKRVIVIVNSSATIFEAELNLLIFQLFSILIAKNRQKQFAAHVLLQWIPVNVKEVCVFGGASVFKHILPPGRVVAHTHMVGYDVQE